MVLDHATVWMEFMKVALTKHDAVEDAATDADEAIQEMMERYLSSFNDSRRKNG